MKNLTSAMFLIILASCGTEVNHTIPSYPDGVCECNDVVRFSEYGDENGNGFHRYDDEGRPVPWYQIDYNHPQCLGADDEEVGQASIRCVYYNAICPDPGGNNAICGKVEFEYVLSDEDSNHNVHWQPEPVRCSNIDHCVYQ